MTTLWNKGKTPDNKEIASRISEFTAGEDRKWDHHLAYYDVKGSLAHVKMLAEVGLISMEELSLLIPELEKMLDLAKKGQLSIDADVEDIHSQVELNLTRSLGEVGKKIHAARSRNDQVLVDLKLFLKEELKEVSKEVEALSSCLLNLSDEHKEVLLPGYTHYQVAMPSSFGLWFAAWAECFAEDLWSVHAAKKLIDKNPLGSAAGYGSSFPIDRESTTKTLGFADLHWNVVNAQLSRGRSEKAVANALATLAFTLGKMSNDIVLYLSQNFGFLKFPDAYTTGSSIMPHKKNPDVFELIRARCNRIQALPNELALIQSNLGSGYHRDWQLMKEHLFPAIQELKDCFNMTTWMLGVIQVNEDILNDDKYKYLFTVEAVNKEVMQGLAFRDAYIKVGQNVESGQFQWKEKLDHTHQGSMGNLKNDKIKRQLEEVLKALY